MAQPLKRAATLGDGLPEVCRLGLATRGGSGLQPEDVEWALARGINYLNWCGHTDGLSQAVAELGRRRSKVILAVQFQSRTAGDAEREFEGMLARLATAYIDIATLYYVESPAEWNQIVGSGGAWQYLNEQKRLGRLRMIGLTSHQRALAAGWLAAGILDMLMIRYNAAHRGAERDVFPAAAERKIPVVTFTGLRWKALLQSTPEDPPGFRAPTAPECYRFCLANPHVTVTLAAPNNRRELEQNLTLLDDWRPLERAEMEEIRRHGERVHRHASAFW